MASGGTKKSTNDSRSRERGSAMVVAMTTLSGLLIVSGLTVLSVQKTVRAAAHDRFASVALFAAESGVSAGMEYLRRELDPESHWSEVVAAGASMPSAVAGNGARSGEDAALLSADLGASYQVEIRNNADDPGVASGDDVDGIVVIRSVGRGPGGATVTVEVEVAAAGVAAVPRPCPGYAQRGIAADGAGRNDCLDVIDDSDVGVFRPSES